MEQLIRFLPIIFRLINIAPQIQEAIRTGVPTVKAVEENARDLLPILAQVGKQLFPEINDKFAPAAAATSALDPARAKWLQTAAVKQFQETHGLVADGWAGDATHVALQLALSKAK